MALQLQTVGCKTCCQPFCTCGFLGIVPASDGMPISLAGFPTCPPIITVTPDLVVKVCNQGPFPAGTFPNANPLLSFPTTFITVEAPGVPRLDGLTLEFPDDFATGYIFDNGSVPCDSQGSPASYQDILGISFQGLYDPSTCNTVTRWQTSIERVVYSPSSGFVVEIWQAFINVFIVPVCSAGGEPFAFMLAGDVQLRNVAFIPFLPPITYLPPYDCSLAPSPACCAALVAQIERAWSGPVTLHVSGSGS
jgi:hypothetical protein